MTALEMAWTDPTDKANATATDANCTADRNRRLMGVRAAAAAGEPQFAEEAMDFDQKKLAGIEPIAGAHPCCSSI